MSNGPVIIFDKSSLESLNLDESVLLDNFYRSNITPLFFVECLADLEKTLRSNSTPEQLVGSLADRTPEKEACSNIHHMKALRGELGRRLDLSDQRGRPMIEGGRAVQLGNLKGLIFQHSEEEEALERWRRREFIEVERQIARKWRKTLSQIDFGIMVKNIMAGLGRWRKPKSLEDAKQITDTIIDYMDPEWLIVFGLQLLGAPEEINSVRADWVKSRRKPLREYLPYFTFMLSINIFFCLVLQTELLRNVKQSHQVDLAYLYYLPFCSIFTSRDNFHAQIVPLFLSPEQTFVNGSDLKEDLKNLDARYAQLPDQVQRQGLMTYAPVPPEDTGFLTTRLWDKYLPDWRDRSKQIDINDPGIRKAMEHLWNKVKEAEHSGVSHNETDLKNIDHLSISRRIASRRGRYCSAPQ
ncbi:MAG: hypothetical protein ACHQIK_15820 [Candidatus Acidiferrales bacterium]